MERKVLNNIRKYKMIESGDTVVVGVSGGHDSMCLLYILYNLKKDLKIDLLVAHVNHGVRGDYARRDQVFVERISKELGLKYYFTEVDMDQYARDHNISSEEAGRILRYSFFNEILEKEAKSKDKAKIAVGHNRNDQAETLLMRIMRGTGIDGLRGIEFKNENIIRPILNLTREEIETYIRDEKIETVIDHTNLESIYTRNKIRLELIPYMEEEFNPNLIDSLWRLSEISRDEVEFLDYYTDKTYDKLLREKNKNKVGLDLKALVKLHKNIASRIIRKSIFEIAGKLQGYGEVHIDSILDLAKSGQTGKQLDLPNNMKASVDYEKLLIYKNKYNESSRKNYSYSLSLGKNDLEEIGLSLFIELIDKEKFDHMGYNRKYTSYFDYDIIKEDLILRNRRPGDRFSPFGMKGSKKLKDFFIDEKISKDQRNQIPLLLEGENILWVLGYRTSEKYKVTKDTRKILLVTYKSIN